MKKRGATLLNIVLIIGLILVSLIAMLSMKKIFFWQAKEVEKDFASQMLDKVRDVIVKAHRSTHDTRISVMLPGAYQYELNISPTRLSIYFPEQNVFSSIRFTIPEVNVMESHIRASGKVEVYRKEKNVYVTDKLECDESDEKCDPGCVALGVCDPACYKDFVKDGVCNIYCVDKNKDGRTNRYDIDKICDPDCYNNVKQGGIYDPDCVQSNDGICDPDTHNVEDLYCDADCEGTNGVCDPDCLEELGTVDEDCPAYENGVCETVYRSENCRYMPKDCDCSTKIGSDGKPMVCNLGCGVTPVDEWGCTDASNIKDVGDECVLTCECDQTKNLVCVGPEDSNGKHCCPKGTFWTGSFCADVFNDGECNRPGVPQIENCRNSGECSCGSGDVCCPGNPAADEKGCITAPNLPEGSNCLCDSECSSGNCDAEYHKCCDLGEKWNHDTNQCVPDCEGACVSPNQYSCPNCDCSKNGGKCRSGEVCCGTDCITPPNYGEGHSCKCHGECASGNCVGPPNNKHCCPADKPYWSDTYGCRKLIVYKVDEGSGKYFDGGCTWGYDKELTCDKINGKDDCTQDKVYSKLKECIATTEGISIQELDYTNYLIVALGDDVCSNEIQTPIWKADSLSAVIYGESGDEDEIRNIISQKKTGDGQPLCG